jgi:NAD(P)-dependent dehydrogenase (short-subunit alcohol dehydrogenase family)
MHPTHAHALAPMESECILITGATGAIGSATVNAFLEEGFRVLGIDVVPHNEAVASGLLNRPHPGLDHPRYDHLVADVTSPIDVQDVLADVRADYQLRHFVGIAGGAVPGESRLDPLDLDLDVFRASVEVNLLGQVTVLREVLSWMSLGHANMVVDRSISFCSSINAIRGLDLHAYSAAKAGLLSLTRTLVKPLGRLGIRVNAVVPGTVETPRTKREWAHQESHFQGLEQSSPLGSLASPADVAEVFLGLSRQRHTTGQSVVVDAGQSVA